MANNPSARNTPAASDERIRNALRLQIDRAINLERSFTRTQLAETAGVNVAQIDAILTRDAAKHRRIKAEDALSIAWALGQGAVSALIAVIGYSARSLEDDDANCPMLVTAQGMAHLSTIATAAADGRIDHVERPGVQRAADMLIQIMTPLSSAGDAV